MFVYGPKQYPGKGYKSVVRRNFENILDRKPLTVHGDGRQSLDYIYVDDVVRILIGLSRLDSPPKVVNVGTGSPISINDLVSAMLEATKTDLGTVFLPTDHTAGSKRYADLSKLRMIFPDLSLTPLNVGLLDTWNSILAEQQDERT
jgi:UDP-glucose 4-epimerase